MKCSRSRKMPAQTPRPTAGVSYGSADLYRDKYEKNFEFLPSTSFKIYFAKRKKKKRTSEKGFESHSRYILRLYSFSKFAANVNKYLVCLISLWFA